MVCCTKETAPSFAQSVEGVVIVALEAAAGDRVHKTRNVNSVIRFGNEALAVWSSLILYTTTGLHASIPGRRLKSV